MARIAKILPIPVEYKHGEMSMTNALAQRGFMRMPGTALGLVPIKTASGKYLTGLDDDSDEIRMLMRSNPEEGKRLKKEVADRRKRLEDATGLDLGPRSEYYSGVYGAKYNTGEVASKVKLMDGNNLFNFNIPEKEIEYWWVVQYTGKIAPSLEAWKHGKAKPGVQFYISNPEGEASIVYKKNTSIVDANESLKKLSLEKRKKVARLCGLPVTESDTEQIVFNQLYNMISKGTIEVGEYKGQDAVNLFNKISALSDKVLNVRNLVKDAIALRVFTKRQGVVYEGEQMIAPNEEELVTDLSLDSRQQELLALDIKVNDKKKMKAAIE